MPAFGVTLHRLNYWLCPVLGEGQQEMLLDLETCVGKRNAHVPQGLLENTWRFIAIPHAGIKRILIVESCDLFSIKLHRGSEFWGG